jgi:hypothetical protein
MTWDLGGVDLGHPILGTDIEPGQLQGTVGLDRPGRDGLPEGANTSDARSHAPTFAFGLNLPSRLTVAILGS